MFERIRNAVFWQETFDETWRHNAGALPLRELGWRWDKRVDEKRALWREQGKRRGLTPSRAVFSALEDIGNAIYDEHPDRTKIESTLVGVAFALYYAASSTDWGGGPWLPPEERLAERWRPYFAIWQNRREARKQDLERRATEITSHQFPQSEIDAGWAKLSSGSVDREVRAIWRCSEPPRKPAHEIAERANVPLRDFVFWMVVLRQQGLMSEQVVAGEHLYHNQRAWLESRQGLDGDKKMLLARLNGG